MFLDYIYGTGKNIYFRELKFAQKIEKDQFGRDAVSPSTKRYEELVLPEFKNDDKRRHQHVLEKLLTQKIHYDYTYEDDQFFQDMKIISKLNPNILFKINTIKVPRTDYEEHEQQEKSEKSKYKYNVYILNEKILIDECFEIYKHSDEQSVIEAKDWID